MKSKKKLMIMILLGIGIISVIGISYAWLSMNILGEKTNVIKVGSLDLVLDESLSNGITMNGAVAVTDEEGLSQEGSGFSLINNGKADICYEIYLDDMDLDEGDIRIDDKYIKYSLDKNTSQGNAKVLTSSGSNPNRMIYSGTIESKETINFKLRLWINSEENGNYSGQVFKGKLRVEAVQCKISKPVMKAYSQNSTDDYHAEEYKTKVTSIETKNNTMIPEDAIESWDVSAAGDNSVIAYAQDDGAGGYKITIGGGNGGIKLKSGLTLFDSFSALTSVDLSYLDTSSVVDMSRMFYGCKSLTSLDLSNFDTSKVTSMYMTFDGCSSLVSIDLSSFDTSNVVNMQYMFNECSALTSLDLSNFNTSRVTSMAQMFARCYCLRSINISNFDTSNVTSMYWLFGGCRNLTEIDVSHFDTTKVTNMSSMFNGCSALTSIDVSNFDTSNVTNMQSLFAGCSSLTTLDVSSFDTSNVTTMHQMFAGCSQLTELDLSNLDTSNVTNMNSMFSMTSSIRQISVSDKWTTENATTTNMFGGSGVSEVFYV